VRPLRLELAGLRSFRGKQSIDFSDLGLFAVVGDTGAGKSSILEAMIFALFNASTWDARGAKVLLSQDADAMTVLLDFAVGERRYRVTRTLFANTRPAIHALRSLDDSEYRFDGDTAVNAEIRRLIGLDYDSFKKTVVLPQGRFADLLNATETERLKILGDLLGLDEIDRLREALEPARQECEARKRETLAARGAFGDDPAGDVRRSEAAEAEARTRLGAMASARDALHAHAADRARIAARASALQTVERESAALVAPAQAIRALVPLDERLRSELSTFEGRQVEAQHALDVAQRELERMTRERCDLASIAAAAAAVERVAADTARLAAESTRLNERATTLRDEAAGLERDREGLETLRSTARSAEEARLSAERSRDELRQRTEHARGVWRAWTRADAALESARETAERTEAEFRDAASRCVELDGEAKAAAAAYDAARAAYEDAERAERAASLAHEAHPGEPCPVCRRRLPRDFEAPEAPNVADAKRACKASERARDECRSRYDGARAQLELLELRRTDAGRALSTMSAEADAARANLVDAGLAPSAESEDVALAALSETLARAEAASEEARVARDREKTAFDGADADIRARSASYARAVKEHDDAVQATEARSRDTDRVRLSVPEAYRPSADAAPPEFARILAVLAQARHTAEAAASAQTRAATAVADVERRLRALDAERRDTVHDAAERRRAELERHLAALVPARDACRVPAPPVLSGVDFGALVRWAETLLRWSEDAHAVVAAQTAEASAELQRAEQAVETILRAYDVATTASFEGWYVEAAQLAGAAAERLTAARTRAERADALDRSVAELEPVARALERLGTYLQNRAFKEFVMRRRERRLLGIATEVLRDMTGGRFAFAEGFAILDGQTNRTRSARTLSGGETFLASLALALALVEVASRTGGKLDALFLDEGFGNLDAAALDEALSELSERASSGKLIGIITHVRGIAEQIDTVLRVQRLAGGSVVDRLEGTALAAFMEDDIGTGLLQAISPSSSS